jgi:Cof subfamily protein (haloacid dehalogenase superfamily)
VSDTPRDAPPVELAVFDPRPDIRLIAADMDGTLLDDEDELHEHFWPLVHELHRLGIVFCPASGRQYYNLRERFAPVADEMMFIAENGTYVVGEGKEISSICLPRDSVTALVHTVRRLAEQGVDVGAVVCGKASAYIERFDAAFLGEVEKYYARLTLAPDLLEITGDGVLKVAVFDFGRAEDTTAPAFAGFAADHQVAVSGEHWVDVMTLGVNKGEGIRRIQHALGITRAQTMTFGDFLNDLEMMDESDWSFAMHNAHPLLRERARYVAPPNSENGVVRTISSVLGLPWIH